MKPLERRVDLLYARLKTRLRRAKGFRTAGGLPNQIVGRHRGRLRVVGTRPAYNAPAGADPGFEIPIRSARVALDLLVRRGRIDRKGLEQAGPHSSSIMGLLLTCLPGDVRLVRLFTRRLLLRLTQIRIHIGGMEKEGAPIYGAIASAGGGYVLLSYHYLKHLDRGRSGGPPAWRRHLAAFGLQALYDCGAFSWLQARRKAERRGEPLPPVDWDHYLADYMAWIEAESLEPYTYMALDVPGDPGATRRLLLQMLRQGLRPVPVFHYQPDWRSGATWRELDWLWRQGFDLIALGNSVGVAEEERRAWVAAVMQRVPPDRQNYHGLGFCSTTAASFAFLSVDGTAYKHGRDLPSRDGGRGGVVLTDLGQRKASAPGVTAIRQNIAYMVGLGDRHRPAGLQLRWDELVDGRTRLAIS